MVVRICSWGKMGIPVVHALLDWRIGLQLPKSKQRNDDVGMFKAYAHGRRSFVLRGQNAWAGRSVFAFPPAWMDGDHEGIELMQLEPLQKKTRLAIIPASRYRGVSNAFQEFRTTNKSQPKMKCPPLPTS